ncbi:unnamed protein product, partial [Iphiclides podalirius]
MPSNDHHKARRDGVGVMSVRLLRIDTHRRKRFGRGEILAVAELVLLHDARSTSLERGIACAGVICDSTRRCCLSSDWDASTNAQLGRSSQLRGL